MVDDANVSRRHAELRHEDDGWSMRDLGSTNGIKVNRRRVERRAPAATATAMTLGVTDLDFELE